MNVIAQNLSSEEQDNIDSRKVLVFFQCILAPYTPRTDYLPLFKEKDHLENFKGEQIMRV